MQTPSRRVRHLVCVNARLAGDLAPPAETAVLFIAIGVTLCRGDAESEVIVYRSELVSAVWLLRGVGMVGGSYTWTVRGVDKASQMCHVAAHRRAAANSRHGVGRPLLTGALESLARMGANRLVGIAPSSCRPRQLQSQGWPLPGSECRERGSRHCSVRERVGGRGDGGRRREARDGRRRRRGTRDGATRVSF